MDLGSTRPGSNKTSTTSRSVSLPPLSSPSPPLSAHRSSPQANKPVASTSTALPSELDFFAAPVAQLQPEFDEASKKEAKKQRKRKRALDEAAAAAAGPFSPFSPPYPADFLLLLENAPPVDYASLLRKHRIKLTGLDLPDPVSSLEEAVERAVQAGGSRESLEVLQTNWREVGLKEPTAIQLASWGVMLAVRLSLIAFFLASH